MKYPKLFDGPSPVGESGVRALDKTAAPYLTIQGGDNTAHKRGMFREVVVNTGDPYISTEYGGVGVESGLVQSLLASPVPFVVRYPGKAVPKPPYGHAPLFWNSTYRAFVGDGYELTYYSDRSVYTDIDANYWPSLYAIGRPTPRMPPEDPDGKGKTVDFYDIAHTNGLTRTYHSISPFPLGYKDETERFVFGISWLAPQDRTTPTTAQNSKLPLMFIGDTGTREMHEVAIPRVMGRDHEFFMPTCVGRGKVQYLAAVKETLVTPGGTVWQAAVDPIISYSEDFGETWNFTTATFLLPYLAKWAAGVYDRDYYDNVQLDYLGLYGAQFYAGEGKVFMFVPAGKRATPTFPDPRLNEYNPMLFIGDAGAGSASMTRVAWPPDDWLVQHGGYPEVLGPSEMTWQVGWRRMAGIKAAHFVYAAGCLYVPIIPYYDTTDPFAAETTGWRIMFTLDWGVTWQYNTADVPANVQAAGYGSFAGTVISPYVSDEKPGTLFFTGFDAAAGNLELWSTTGLFDKWTRVFVKRGVTNLDLVGGPFPTGDPTYDVSFYGVNFGNKKVPACIYPAFPGEFEAP